MRQLLSSKFWLSSAAKIRQLSTVYLPVLLLDLAYSSILTNTSFYTSYLGLSSTFLGVLMAVTTAFFAVLAIPFGRLSDRIDRRYALYAACLVLGAVSVGLPRCRNSMHLMLIFPGIGISMALFWPAYEAWLAEREGGGKLIQRVMLFNLFWSTGITLGPAFSSYLYGDANPFKPFYLAGVMVLLTLGTIIANSWQTSGVLKTDSASEVNEESIETLYPPQPVRTSYLNIARCANFTSWFTLGVLRRLAPKLTKEMGMIPSTFGNLMLTLGGMQTMAFLILGSGYSTRWHYRFAPMLIVQLLAAFSFLGIWRLQHTLLWTAAFGVVGVSAAFTYFSSLYYGLDRHVDKGNKSGWHEAILGLGILLGPLLGGILADSRFGTQSPYLLCAGATVIAILVEIFIVSKMPKPSGGSL
ncbi:MFS transporter [Candidatus Poribacteria bacterium]|nr:MFS transporter [Candidatus Poribacteria bacterium]